MKTYHKNPRKITDKQFKDLKQWLAELGDLSGVVHNLETDEIIGGNQRSKVFGDAPIDGIAFNNSIELKEQYAFPDEQGTVGLGYILWNGKKYNYRQVRWTPEQAEKANIIANKAGGDWDWGILESEFKSTDLLDWGFQPNEFIFTDTELKIQERDLRLDPEEPIDRTRDATPSKTLAERFLVPPFSVLDARQGYWQERKRAWIALGLHGELGRGLNLLDVSAIAAGITDPDEKEIWNENRRTRNGKGTGRAFGEDLMHGERDYSFAKNQNANLDDKTKKALGAYAAIGGGVVARNANHRGLITSGQTWTKGVPRTDEVSLKILNTTSVSGTSVFDPVLCEIVYRWFLPPGGSVLDPFAGEATKGVVAGVLGHSYTGIELRLEQVEENVRQASGIASKLPMTVPTWLTGDSSDMDAVLPTGGLYDLIFTSPPYYDLEIYSESEKDGSAFETYEKFMIWYQNIFSQCVDRLQENRFLVVKVGEIRDEKGIYRNFVGDTTRCMLDLGLQFYNEAILVTAVGSLPIRVSAQFATNRKLGKTHQNILVFYKGNPKRIKEEFGTAEMGFDGLDDLETENLEGESL